MNRLVRLGIFIGLILSSPWAASSIRGEPGCGEGPEALQSKQALMGELDGAVSVAGQRYRAFLGRSTALARRLEAVWGELATVAALDRELEKGHPSRVNDYFALQEKHAGEKLFDWVDNRVEKARLYTGLVDAAGNLLKAGFKLFGWRKKPKLSALDSKMLGYARENQTLGQAIRIGEDALSRNLKWPGLAPHLRLRLADLRLRKQFVGKQLKSLDLVRGAWFPKEKALFGPGALERAGDLFDAQKKYQSLVNNLADTGQAVLDIIHDRFGPDKPHWKPPKKAIEPRNPDEAFGRNLKSLQEIENQMAAQQSQAVEDVLGEANPFSPDWVNLAIRVALEAPVIRNRESKDLESITTTLVKTMDEDYLEPENSHAGAMDFYLKRCLNVLEVHGSGEGARETKSILIGVWQSFEAFQKSLNRLDSAVVRVRKQLVGRGTWPDLLEVETHLARIADLADQTRTMSDGVRDVLLQFRPLSSPGPEFVERRALFFNLVRNFQSFRKSTGIADLRMGRDVESLKERTAKDTLDQVDRRLQTVERQGGRGSSAILYKAAGQDRMYNARRTLANHKYGKLLGAYPVKKMVLANWSSGASQAAFIRSILRPLMGGLVALQTRWKLLDRLVEVYRSFPAALPAMRAGNKVPALAPVLWGLPGDPVSAKLRSRPVGTLLALDAMTEAVLDHPRVLEIEPLVRVRCPGGKIVELVPPGHGRWRTVPVEGFVVEPSPTGTGWLRGWPQTGKAAVVHWETDYLPSVDEGGGALKRLETVEAELEVDVWFKKVVRTYAHPRHLHPLDLEGGFLVGGDRGVHLFRPTTEQVEDSSAEAYVSVVGTFGSTIDHRKQEALLTHLMKQPPPGDLKSVTIQRLREGDVSFIRLVARDPGSAQLVVSGKGYRQNVTVFVHGLDLTSGSPTAWPGEPVELVATLDPGNLPPGRRYRVAFSLQSVPEEAHDWAGIVNRRSAHARVEGEAVGSPVVAGAGPVYRARFWPSTAPRGGRYEVRATLEEQGGPEGWWGPLTRSARSVDVAPIGRKLEMVVGGDPIVPGAKVVARLRATRLPEGTVRAGGLDCHGMTITVDWATLDPGGRVVDGPAAGFGLPSESSPERITDGYVFRRTWLAPAGRGVRGSEAPYRLRGRLLADGQVINETEAEAAVGVTDVPSLRIRLELPAEVEPPWEGPIRAIVEGLPPGRPPGKLLDGLAVEWEVPPGTRAEPPVTAIRESAGGYRSESRWIVPGTLEVPRAFDGTIRAHLIRRAGGDR